MNNCYVITSWQDFELNKDSVSFKSQKIYNAKLENVAEEILFNAGAFPADGILKYCQLFFSHPTYIEQLVIATRNRAIEAGLDRIFINIEQQTLCDQWSIAQLIQLNNTLKNHQCELVVEITERMNCGHCQRLEQGLKTLKAANITLALDDYDLQPHGLPFKLDYFDIIKVTSPEVKLISQLEKELISNEQLNHKEIVVESIEDKPQLEQLLNGKLDSSKLSLQGYLLHKPEPISH
ncbi:EAL domain-containing protein [Shewanella sp. A25]|nr:EAL domain-containing protein [Shewanella shenzhenensis]